jgi:type VI secretion system protein ImpA
VNGEPFLRAIEGDAPSGVELRHTQEFLQIEALLEPAARKNRIDSNGELNLTASVDWSKLLADAEKLASTGRDLRLLIIVARVWTNQTGFTGLAAGCELISDSLLAHWDGIHPELRDRPDKAMAAKGREGAIRGMENRDEGILGDLEMRVVLEPRGLPPVRGAELAQAAHSDYEYMQIGTGGMSAEEKAEHSSAHAQLQAKVQTAILATRDEAPETIPALVEQIDAADRARAALEAAYAKAGGFENGSGCRLGDLATFLAQCKNAIEAVAGDEAPSPQPGGVETMDQTASAVPASQGQTAAGASASGGGLPSRLDSRREVEKCLDLIIEFYERTEPSSPIPHLATRMRRMVPMDFLQLIEEVAPGGVKDFKNVAGVGDKKRSE